MFATQLVGRARAHVVGKISDLHDMQLGLQIAVAVMVCGALLMLLVIHFIRRDGSASDPSPVSTPNRRLTTQKRGGPKPPVPNQLLMIST